MREKILIIGTSHTGAFYTARDAIAAGFPDLDVSYFGLPGRVYSSAVYEGGVFRAPEDMPRQLAWMDRREIDFAPFSHILHVGERYALNHVMRLMVFHDVLEEPERTGRAFISSAALADMIRGTVARRAERLLERFGKDSRACFLPAPYPLARSTRPGAGHEYALAALGKRAHGAKWMALYEQIIEEEMHKAGLDVLLQPPQTRAGQFMTADRFARAGTDQSAPPDQVDHRHMNADYGWQVFCAFAQRCLGQTPESGFAVPEQQQKTG